MGCPREVLTKVAAEVRAYQRECELFAKISRIDPMWKHRILGALEGAVVGATPGFVLREAAHDPHGYLEGLPFLGGLAGAALGSIEGDKLISDLLRAAIPRGTGLRKWFGPNLLPGQRGVIAPGRLELPMTALLAAGAI